MKRSESIRLPIQSIAKLCLSISLGVSPFDQHDQLQLESCLSIDQNADKGHVLWQAFDVTPKA
jgi:hypothetical protein